MSETVPPVMRGLAGILVVALATLAGAPARAENPASGGVTILDLPFPIKAMRGPGSEVALAVATSGLVPTPKPKAVSADPKAKPRPGNDASAPIAIVWGDRGGAALSLDGAGASSINVSPIAVEAVEGFVAAETPRGAVSGSRLAQSGPLTAYLTGPARSADGLPDQAGGLTIREREPIGVTAEPKSVPIATATVAPGPDRLFASRRPRIASTRDGAVIFAVVADAAASSLVAVTKGSGGAWTLAAASAPQASNPNGAAPVTPAAVADFLGNGGAQVAAIQPEREGGALRLWSYANGVFTASHEMAGYGAPIEDRSDPAAIVAVEGGSSADLAIPTWDGRALAILSVKDGFREKARFALPARARFGVAVLGTGAAAKVLVGLEDGRIASVPIGLGARP